MKKFVAGDIAYFIESSSIIRQVTVLRNSGGFCTICFDTENGSPSGIRVRESKLFKTEKEAKEYLGAYKKWVMMK